MYKRKLIISPKLCLYLSSEDRSDSSPGKTFGLAESINMLFIITVELLVSRSLLLRLQAFRNISEMKKKKINYKLLFFFKLFVC